ncbi:IS110 family transposase [Streptomyces sp. NBC_00056]|uniref:IS110 family transposase n=1 Tax=Streptomyces sp. NBC_00056 TaxID=2975633 RepID=UPI003254946D
MILLGVDPHQSTHTAAAVDPVSNQQAGSLRIEASLAEYRCLLTWGRRWPQRRWVVENANGLGRHLAQWLVAGGETGVDVPGSATSRVRQLARGGGRKNDRIDAAAAATAHIHGDGREVDVDDHTTALALLDEPPTQLRPPHHRRPQIRMLNSVGHAYCQRKLSEGKTPREAKRCLKHCLADHVWRVVIADEGRSKHPLPQAT